MLRSFCASLVCSTLFASTTVSAAWQIPTDTPAQPAPRRSAAPSSGVPPAARAAVAPAGSGVSAAGLPTADPAPATLVLPPGTVLGTALSGVFRTASARGTTLALVLQHPQLLNHRMALPEGASLQGEVVSVKRNGHLLPVYKIRLRSADLILPDSTTVPLNGDLEVTAGESALPYETYLPRKKDMAWIGTGAAIAVGSLIVGGIKEASAYRSSANSFSMTPSASPALPPMPGNGGMKIMLVGALIGGAVALVGVFGQHENGIIYPGAPLQVTLSRPLQLTAAQIQKAALSARPVTIPPPPVIYPENEVRYPPPAPR
jgi:hypothetical protein